MTVTQTPRFGLEQYSAGGDPHPTREKHNEMIGKLESLAAQYVADAVRPAAGVAGRFWKDAAANRVYLDDGTAWGEITAVGGGGAGAGVVVAGAGAEGVSARAARADHTHPLPLATAAAHGGMSAADKSKLDAATSAGTAGALVQADANGNYSAAAPTADSHVATRAYVAQQIATRAAAAHTHDAANINTGTLAVARLPLVTTAAAGAMTAADKTKLDGATSAATAGALVARDASGRIAVGTPAAAGDASTKGYVDQQIGTRAALAHRHAWADLDSVPATFAPSAHRHAWGDLDGVPTSFTPSVHFHPWADIQNKPSWIGATKPAYASSEISHPGSASVADSITVLTNSTQSAHSRIDSLDQNKLNIVAFNARIGSFGASTSLRSPNGQGELFVGDDNTVASIDIFNKFVGYTGSWRAVHVHSDGSLGHTVSALRYKTNIRPAEVTAEQVYAIAGDAVTYELKAAPGQLETGYIAERLIEAGLEEFCFFNPDGTVEGIHYDRLSVAALLAVGDLNRRLAELEGKD